VSYVLGIDPSMTATGLAWIARPTPLQPGPVIESTTFGEKGHRDDTLVRRGQRIDRIVSGLADVLYQLRDAVDLAVIEGASHGSVGGSAWDRAGLWWALVRCLHGANIPLAVCAPLTRIKWATGKGKATQSTKADVAVALVRMWPDAKCDSDNEWDALAMASIGAQHLGWPVPRLARHDAAQQAITWPVLGPAVELEAS